MSRISFAEYCYQQTVGKNLDPSSLDLEQAKVDYDAAYPELKVCVFVDDLRIPTQRIAGYGDWILCRSWAEWVEYLSLRGVPDHVSFDHDLDLEHLEDFRKYEYEGIPAIHYQDFKQYTGLGCAQYYCAFCDQNNLEMKGVAAHCTERPMGAHNIVKTLNDYKQAKGLQPDCFVAEVPTRLLSEALQEALGKRLQ